MDDLEALPPEPANDTNAVTGMMATAGSAARRRISRRAKVLLAATGAMSMTLAGVVAGVALAGGTPSVQLADPAAATGTNGAPATSGPVCPAPRQARVAIGTVATVDSKGTGFTLTAKARTVTLAVNGATIYQALDAGTATDLRSGAPVLVRTERKDAAGTTPNAVEILIAPAATGSPGTTKPQPQIARITATNLSNGTGTVTVSTPTGARTVNITSSTKIFKVVTAAFSDLATGQAVYVAGVPAAAPSSTTITGARVLINRAGGVAPFGPFGLLVPTVRRPECGARMPASLRGRAAGTVGNLNGTTFSLTGPGGATNVTTSSATVFTKQVPESVSTLKPGTQIAVRGTLSTDGTTIAASQLAVPPVGAPMKAPVGPAGHGRGLAVGTVTANDPSTGTLSIKTADGTILKVTTTPNITVSATVPAALSDVRNGDVALVTGTPDASGTSAATRVVIRPPGQAPLGPGRLFGRGDGLPFGGGPFGGGSFGGGSFGGGSFGGGPFGGPFVGRHRGGPSGLSGPTG